MITYRSNRTGTLHAAYLGSVRVGYVEMRSPYPRSGWLWQLILLRPEGGALLGVADTDDDARAALRTALDYWLQCAGLQSKTTEETTR